MCVCMILCVCRWRGEACRHPKALPPIYAPQETPPPKDKLLFFLPTPTASRETAHSCVSTHSNTHSENIHKAVSIHSLMLLYGLPAQVWKPQVWGRGFDTRFCPWQVTWHWWVWLERALSNGIRTWCVRGLSIYNMFPAETDAFLCFVCVCVEIDLDAVVTSTEKLSHPTASRPRVTDRRPRSQIITPVSVCSQPCQKGVFKEDLPESP